MLTVSMMKFEPYGSNIEKACTVLMCYTAVNWFVSYVMFVVLPIMGLCRVMQLQGIVKFCLISSLFLPLLWFFFHFHLQDLKFWSVWKLTFLVCKVRNFPHVSDWTFAPAGQNVWPRPWLFTNSFFFFDMGIFSWIAMVVRLSYAIIFF